MENYDVIVVGAGSGSNISSKAVSHGLDVALIEKEYPGGTCLNWGCIPSKVMIHPADIIQEAKEAKELGVNFDSPEIDFDKIMERTQKIYKEDRKKMTKNLEEAPGIDYYNEVGKFVKDYTLEVDGKEIQGDKIFLFTGARPLIPPIEGIEEVDYLTNKNVFEIEEKPESMIFIGGGFIAAELAHFFAAVDTEVTILEQEDRILPNHDPEISETVQNKLSSRMNIETSQRVEKVKENNGEKIAFTKNTDTGDTQKFSGEELLVAAGRKSNADILQVEKTGVETDEKGWIITNENLETTKENIWAGGDAIGKHMFKHVANYEASVAWHNAFSDHVKPVDYHAVPGAVYTRPQVATVGMSVNEARKSDREVLVGKLSYGETAKGYALNEEDGFCRILVDQKSGEILGAQIVGSNAPILIQEVVNLMNTKTRSVQPLSDSMHIHPALSEVVAWSLDNLEKLE